MAREKQLAILRQGVEAWNQWRSGIHWSIDFFRPDLSEADLRGANLRGANFSEVNLRGADLGRADLGEADLGGADLRGANLSAANLSAAILSAANLSKANLRMADLTRANLRGANCSHANFSEFESIGTELSDSTKRKADRSRGIFGGHYLSENYSSGSFLAWPYLSRTNLGKADLRGANLSEANLVDVNLSEANLSKANLRKADLRIADLRGANLSEANLIDADLREASLREAVLTRADFERARLSQAVMICAILNKTHLVGADLTGSWVYGISVWDTDLEGAIQENVVITDYCEPKITVDNLEVAQFIHILLTNKKIRDVIDTIAKKVVLILGRFSERRKAVLDAIRERLRHEDYLPVLFDFDKPASRNLTETVRTLAHLSRFIIADLTEAKSIPQELTAIVERLKVPVVPIASSRARIYGMWGDFEETDWVLAVYRYQTKDKLLEDLVNSLIPQALEVEDNIAKKRQRKAKKRKSVQLTVK